MNDFAQKIILTLFDKLIIGVAILLAGYWITKDIEKFSSEQAILKEYEVLRDKTALQHLQRQIEELYSPLLGLIEYSTAVYRIASLRLPSIGNWRHVKHSKEEVEIWLYFEEKYFLPLFLTTLNLYRSYKSNLFYC